MRATESGAAVRLVLSRMLESTGAERAFLVRLRESSAGDRSFLVETSVSRRKDGACAPSRSVLRRAAVARRVVVLPEGSWDRALLDGASVKSLDLRWVAGAPIPRAYGPAALLVIDSREKHPAPPSRLEEVIGGFAGLVGVVLGQARHSPARAEGAGATENEPIVGRSATLRRLLQAVRRVAGWRLPVLVTGESGSGKELIARMLHRESDRGDGPFVAVNCAAIPETLIDAELFGARRGAYTGLDRDRTGLVRRADGGTLLLDEVGDMSPVLQARLLRFLQESRVLPLGDETEHPVNVRVVAATHRDLRRRIDEGRFRADLYYRLAAIELHVPALRERRDDIPLLARHLVGELARKTCQEPARLSEEAIDRLRRQDWPGNVRELEAAIARGMLRAAGGEILPSHLDLPRRSAPVAKTPPRSLEREMIESALRESGGNLTRAAARIGWSRQKLGRKMTTLGIDRPPRRFP